MSMRPMGVPNRRYLEIDLTMQTTRWLDISDQDLRSYFLGSGIAAHLFSKVVETDPDPFGEDAPLMIFNGLLTGSFSPTACRTTWCCRSPLTGIWNEANMGGEFGAVMNFAGTDGFVITGKSEEPVYIRLDHGQVEFLPAQEIWGKDHFEVDDILHQRYGKHSQSASIGPAGERMIPIASVLQGGARHTRAAARGGIGAVMGSKLLKAIVVCGDRKPEYPDLKGLQGVVRSINQRLREKSVVMSQLGTAGGVVASENAGDFPLKNWKEGSWKEGAAKITGQSIYPKYLQKHNHCFACPIGCSKNVYVDSDRFGIIQGHGPEYETLGSFGGNCLCDDLEAILYMNELCNRYGLDTMSTGGVIAFAMEAYEKGMVKIEDMNGINLTWGNAHAMIAMIHAIAHQEGLGRLLGMGVKKASMAIKGSDTFAVHVKGLEVAYHDPRAFVDMAANYATANRGACHLEGCSYWMGYGSRWPGWYAPETYDPHQSEGKARVAKDFQDYFSTYNPLGLCKFLIKSGITPQDTADMINSAMGWNMTANELLTTGERIFNQKRWINCQFGIRRKDDTLPHRLLMEARPSGGAEGVLPDLGKMLEEYYQLRGWNPDGIPSEATMDRLSLRLTGTTETE